jgi:hypothetical protein
MNTLCFIGTFQFLAGFLITKSLFPLVVFINGIILHGGYRTWLLPDTVTNLCLMLWAWITSGFDMVIGLCFLTACTTFGVNFIESDIIHVAGVQYISLVAVLLLNQYKNPYLMKISFPGKFTEDVIPVTILLGIIVAALINGTSRLANGGTAQERAPKARLA